MKLSELKPNPGAMTKTRRLGRGPGSGKGTTAGRGYNGQRARAGSRHPVYFEGGQMPLTRSTPKRGFTNIFRREYETINISDLELKAAGQSTVDVVKMKTLGIVSNSAQEVKVLGHGEITIPLTVRAHAFSASAIEKIKKAGGKTEIITTVKKVEKE